MQESFHMTNHFSYFYHFLTTDARAARNMDEWQASTAQDLQTKLPGMYDLLTRGVTSMKLLSANGVLPGSNSSDGATSTYNPSSQTCSTGCGLDGSGCGNLGNVHGDVNPCENRGKRFVNQQQQNALANSSARNFLHYNLLFVLGPIAWMYVF